MVAEWLHSGCRVVAEARPPNKFKRFLTIASIAKKSRTLWLFLVQACPRLVVCLRLQCLRQSQFHYLLPALFAKGLLGGWHTMGGSRAEARPPHKFKRFLPPHKFKRFLTIANSEYCKQNQVKIGGSRVAAEGGGGLSRASHIPSLHFCRVFAALVAWLCVVAWWKNNIQAAAVLDVVAVWPGDPHLQYHLQYHLCYCKNNKRTRHP